MGAQLIQVDVKNNDPDSQEEAGTAYHTRENVDTGLKGTQRTSNWRISEFDSSWRSG